MMSATPGKQYWYLFEINYIYERYSDADGFENQVLFIDSAHPFALGLKKNCFYES